MRQRKKADDELSDTDINPEVTPLDAGSVASEELSQPQRTWGEFITSSFLLLTCLASLAIAALGSCLLVYVFFSRSFAPPRAHLVRPLYFDYSDSSAVASASFLDSSSIKELSSRAFLAGQQMNIWLELEAAEAGGSVNTDLFQVLAQLVTSDGKTAATASRPCLLTSWSPYVRSIRSLVSTPMVLLGLWREHQTLKVPLFSRYPDQADRPFVAFKAVLRATTQGGQLPHLYSARVHVDLVLGLFGRIVYWMRPGRFTTLGLAAGALGAMVGGTLVGLTTFLYWFFAAPKAHAPSHSPPRSEAGDDDSDTEVPSPTPLGSPSRRGRQSQESGSPQARPPPHSPLQPARGVPSLSSPSATPYRFPAPSVPSRNNALTFSATPPQFPAPSLPSRSADAGGRPGLNSWVEDETLQSQLDGGGAAGLTHRRGGAQLI